MNHKENFDSPVDVRQASNDREREREREKTDGKIRRWSGCHIFLLQKAHSSLPSFVAIPSRAEETRPEVLSFVLSYATR